MSQSTASLAVDRGSRRRQLTEAIFGREQRSGQQQRWQLREAVDGGSRRRQLTETVDGNSRQRQSSTGSNVGVNSSIGGQRRQPVEAVDGGNLWRGATLRSRAASAGRDRGDRWRLEFLLLASECGEGIKIAIFFTVQFYMHKNHNPKQSPTK